ncbi:MAG: hypothetical protein EBU49_01790 [Proteobacteria bacterium]|nr:hypothetical protein [Pseudomonadota bacterium]
MQQAPRSRGVLECEAILRNYIRDNLNLPPFTITKVETGAIPMTLNANPRFPATCMNSVIDVIGGAAGMVKPSTGYSFQRNFESLSQQTEKPYGHFRFQVYDALLLRIIQVNGGMISKLFPVLFSANTPSKLFAFLDGGPLSFSVCGVRQSALAPFDWRSFSLGDSRGGLAHCRHRTRES